LIKKTSIPDEDRQLLLDTMKKFVDISIASQVFKRKEKNERYAVFLGLGAIKELARIIESSLNEKGSQHDLLQYTTSIINSWKIKYVFFRDFLLDYSKYFPLPDAVINGIERTISHWHGMQRKIMEKKDYRDELNRMFGEFITQLENIYEEQTKIFTEIAEIIKHD
jgi:hypothetical protein